MVIFGRKVTIYYYLDVINKFPNEPPYQRSYSNSKTNQRSF